MSNSLPPRDGQRLRAAERLIVRLLRKPAGLELARARQERIEALLELGEEREAGVAFAELVEQLAALEGVEARALLCRTLAQRARLRQRDGEASEEALEDLRRAIASLAALNLATPPGAPEPPEPPDGHSPDAPGRPDRRDPGPDTPSAPEPRGPDDADARPAAGAEAAASARDPNASRGEDVAELEVDLQVLLGRSLLLAGRVEESEEALRGALRRAARLREPARRLHLLRARRELATALAQTDVRDGLRELVRAERAAGDGELPRLEQDLCRSTRAEMLANAGRIPEAILVLSEGWQGDAPEWALVQQAATLDLGGELAKALEVGALLIERRSRGLDPRDPSACHGLAEALLAQARRTASDEERAALATRCLRLLEDLPHLPPRGLRLVSGAQEVLASALTDPAEAHGVLRARVQVLEGLLRDDGAERDRIELTRAYLQLGDALMRLDEPREARRVYGWGIAELRRWPPEHPFVLDVLPLALNALSHALATDGLWLAAQRHLDEAARSIAARSDPEALAELADVLLFRAIAYLNVGDPRSAVSCLEQDVTGLLGAALKESGPVSAELIDGVINLYVLQAEVLMDHLDAVDRAVASYDQALRLREMSDEPAPATLASIMGAKGSMLNDAGRAEEALPSLVRCLELFEDGDPDDPEARGDVAQARVNLAASLSGLGRQREALAEIERANALLSPNGGEVEDDPRREAIFTQLYLQRGEALRRVGHPLLGADELTRSVELCRNILEEDEEEEAVHEARLRLPYALLRRAHCWLEAGDHPVEASSDLREARRLYADLVRGEARPEHRRRLREVKELIKGLDGNGAYPAGDGPPP